MRPIFILWLTVTAFLGKAQFQLSYTENKTPEYDEVIGYYGQLAQKHKNAALMEMGPTDSGRNLHLFLISGDPVSSSSTLQEISKGKAVILINNGIHPGESCGIDASLAFARELLKAGVPKGVVIAIIPVYNIGGSLNRGAYSRANQLGPEEHGFRGNARNLDLNRDFIKADALNTLSFYAIFQALQPHIFVDTHTSNGADYQYTMTLISTQKDKLKPVLGNLMAKGLEPHLYKSMAKIGWPMTPYVNVFGYTPDKGFSAFLETPRYASGYTALFNTIGFITETHMLKPYKDRVESTIAFLEIITEYASKHAPALMAAKVEADALDRQKKYFELNWGLDSTAVDTLFFEGYGYEYIASQVSGAQRLKYLRDKPVTYQVQYLNSYKALDSAEMPAYYVVPAAWREVPLRLQYNNVEMIPLKKDSLIAVSSYYIKDAEFAPGPYEGHFPLKSMAVEKIPQKRKFLKGDYLVPTNQKNRRFIAAVLEPNAVDSYLRWNFYDEIFQQKEYFSPYVFEETAAQLLRKDMVLKQKFEEWKTKNPTEAANGYGALLFIYRSSGYYEKEHLRYPVARIE